MSTRLKIAQSSCMVGIIVCIIALIYDDLNGYRMDGEHLICGWSGLCLKRSQSDKYECVTYDECDTLTLSTTTTYNCNSHKVTGEIYLAFGISCIVIAAFTLIFNKCTPSNLFRVFNLFCAILSIIAASWWIDKANDGFPCYDTTEMGHHAYIGLSLWFLYTATCLFCIAACLSWKDREGMKKFRMNKNKQSVDYQYIHKQEVQQSNQKIVKPHSGIVVNLNYNSMDQNEANNDSLYHTQELVPISSLTSTQ